MKKDGTTQYFYMDAANTTFALSPFDLSSTTLGAAARTIKPAYGQSYALYNDQPPGRTCVDEARICGAVARGLLFWRGGQGGWCRFTCWLPKIMMCFCTALSTQRRTLARWHTRLVSSASRTMQPLAFGFCTPFRSSRTPANIWGENQLVRLCARWLVWMVTADVACHCRRCRTRSYPVEDGTFGNNMLCMSLNVTSLKGLTTPLYLKRPRVRHSHN